MLDKANHYNFIRNHIKQIENLFKENFEGFESEFDDSYYIIKEDIPVLEGTYLALILELQIKKYRIFLMIEIFSRK